MSVKDQLTDLQEIKLMMEKSSRFISLSGWSGIAAGICALGGAFAAQLHLRRGVYSSITISGQGEYNYFPFFLQQLLHDRLFHIALATFISAFISAFIFTYLRSRNSHLPVWGGTARRLTINVLVPMFAGGIFLIKMVEYGNYDLVAPGCLIFYGLALINGSKYTLGEIKYLGYCQLALGLASCWLPNWGLYFWAFGFGILHIVYGLVMWYKYERA